MAFPLEHDSTATGSIKQAISSMVQFGLDLHQSVKELEDQKQKLTMKKERWLLANEDDEDEDDPIVRRCNSDGLLGRQLFDLPTDHRDISYVEWSTEEQPITSCILETFQMVFKEQIKDEDDDDERNVKCSIKTRLLSDIGLLRQISSGLIEVESMMQNLDDIAVTKERAPSRGIPESCEICGDEAELPFKVSQCSHVFCTGCIENSKNQAAVSAIRDCKCPKCGVHVPSLYDDYVHTVGEIAVEKGLQVVTKRRKGPTSKRLNTGNYETREPQPGEDMYRQKPKVSFRSRLLDRIDRGEAPLVKGAKMQALEMTIQKWQRETPDGKIIVFAHFSLTCELIRRVLQGLGIKFAYFLGETSGEAREQIIKDFENDPELKVLVVSLKCGGEARNLQSANRVICVEIWWNCGMKERGFGRVFRLGQTKETYFQRILIKDSVESAILGLQLTKQKRIGKALQENAPLETGQLVTIEEIAAAVGYDIKTDGDIKLEPQI
ncbi:P-loop containing nucleoside triphosphate hydrolase protein [Xylariaceae sp. FL0016]|nr:P-loop containing nucleoside triphosphate hydrolase protein [Xylariaceae sp. FL0016]